MASLGHAMCAIVEKRSTTRTPDISIAQWLLLRPEYVGHVLEKRLTLSRLEPPARHAPRRAIIFADLIGKFDVSRGPTRF